MKLIAAAKRLEELAGKLGGMYGHREPVALVWTAHEELALPPDDGQVVAVDVFEGDEFEGARIVRTVERLSSDPGDLGVVYAAGGERVGRVVEREGSLMTIAYTAGATGEVIAAAAPVAAALKARPRAVRVRRPRMQAS